MIIIIFQFLEKFKFAPEKLNIIADTARYLRTLGESEFFLKKNKKGSLLKQTAFFITQRPNALNASGFYSYIYQTR